MNPRSEASGNEILLTIPSPEEMHRAAVAFVGSLAFSALRDFVLGYPCVPSEPGLYAVVAPDGVTAKVVDSSVATKDLRSMILRDVAGRLLRSFHRDCIEQGMSFDQISEAAFPKITAAKKLYRLEKL